MSGIDPGGDVMTRRILTVAALLFGDVWSGRDPGSRGATAAW